MIASFSPYFMKSSFDIPTTRPKKKKKRIPPSLFTHFYKRVNQIDRTQIEDTTYNEWNVRTLLAEKLEPMKFKQKERIINNLVYDKSLFLETLSMLCSFYKVNVYFVRGRTVVKMVYSDEPDAPIWFMNDTNQFIEEIDVSNYLEISLEKPLKAVSGYCLSELKEMSAKLLLPIEKYKKQELYQSIKQVVNQLYKIEE
jgi:hypothetical protein